MAEVISRDNNWKTVGAGIDPNDHTDIQMLRVDPITKYLLVSVVSGLTTQCRHRTIRGVVPYTQ